MRMQIKKTLVDIGFFMHNYYMIKIRAIQISDYMLDWKWILIT